MSKPALTFNNLVEERIDSLLYNLNESMITNLKMSPSLKAIKDVTFYLDQVPLSLKCKVKFKSGIVVDELFSSHVDEGAIHFSRSEVEAYYGPETLKQFEKHLEDGSLDFNYLQAHGPELLDQLSKIYLLDSSPNTLEGAEFTEQDLHFFEELIKNNP